MALTAVRENGEIELYSIPARPRSEHIAAALFCNSLVAVIVLALYRVEGGSERKIWPSYKAVTKTRQGGELRELIKVATKAALMPCNEDR